VRRGGPPWLPAPAWTGEGAWVRDLEPAALPQTRNPARGWIVTANNRQTGAGYPHFLSRHYDLAYRAARIAELVQADSPATVASTSRHQMDIRDGFARRHRALAARAAQALGRADLADRLRAWPGDMRVDAVEPAVFWSWYRELERLIYEDQSPYYRPAWALDRWMAGEEGGGAGSGDPWIDDVRTPERETLDSLARRAMTAVIGARAPGPWGRLHRIVMNHPLAGVPVLGRWLGFRVGPLEAPGSNYTVNNARSPAEGPPFTSEWGPSLRHVVDFGNVDGAGGFILPTGQSGHPLSRHYRNQTERWRRGELWIIPVDVGRVRTVDTLLLVRGGAMSQRGSPPGARRLMGTKKTPQGFPWGASLARHRAP
ncbi:MAG TPA: penicillin acylase family protein, partial [Gemmatimonadales bacterium]|nr:penicillin acylase family protein [Gemmatimonadales bacterium]